MSAQHPGEVWRHAVDARRTTEHGGGACTLLIHVIDGRVELLFHADPTTGAVLTRERAAEVSVALTTAAQKT